MLTPLVGGLRAQDCRDEQLKGSSEVQLGVRVRIQLRQLPVDLARSAD